MPIYEYQCRACGHRFERIQRLSDRKVRTCPECKGRVDRLVHAPAIQFKGTGWYVTDYSEKGKKPASKDDKPAGDKPDSGSGPGSGSESKGTGSKGSESKGSGSKGSGSKGSGSKGSGSTGSGD